MTEPVKRFGGLGLDWNQVKNCEIKQNKNGEKTYFIEFKTGVTAEYPMQKTGYIESRELTLWQSFDYDTQTHLTGANNVKIKGSKNDDHILIDYSTNTTVDVGGDNNDDEVHISPPTDQDSSTVTLDKKDKAIFYKGHTGPKVYQLDHSAETPRTYNNISNEIFEDL